MMKYLLALLVFVFFVILIYQTVSGFPLISNIRQKKRRNRWNERQKTKKENEEKIKLLTKKLTKKGEIDLYVSLNRFNLPEDEEWKPLFPNMIKDLLAIGWTTEMPIYTTFKYGSYNFYISNSDQNIVNQSIPIFHKYLDLYEEIRVK